MQKAVLIGDRGFIDEMTKAGYITPYFDVVGVHDLQPEDEIREDYDVCVLVSKNPLLDMPHVVSRGISRRKIRNFLYLDILHKELGYGTPQERFFGQNLEDAVLVKLFQELGMPLESLRYIEIGTNEPIFGNNSFYFYEHGASGILVDPLPEVAIMASMARPRDRMLTAAVSGTKSGSVSFFVDYNNTAVASLHDKWTKGFRGGDNAKSVEVRCFHINELLQKAGFVPDLLLVDAEGEDENIILNLDYEQFSPKVIIVESLNPRVINHLREKKYRFYCNIANVNAIFYRE